MTWVDLWRLWVVCLSLDLGVGAIIPEMLFKFIKIDLNLLKFREISEMF